MAVLTWAMGYITHCTTMIYADKIFALVSISLLEGPSIMKPATLLLVAAFGLSLPALALAAMPAGKVAVVRVTAIDGLAGATGDGTESRANAFTFDGTEYHINHDALSNLNGVETLLLIDRRKDEMSGNAITRSYSQEVRSFPSTHFVVTDVKGKVLSYQVAMIGGNLRLLGDPDQIQATGGAHGPFHIWKVESYDLVDRSAITVD
jgi:hypothetical protein